MPSASKSPQMATFGCDRKPVSAAEPLAPSLPQRQTEKWVGNDSDLKIRESFEGRESPAARVIELNIDLKFLAQHVVYQQSATAVA